MKKSSGSKNLKHSSNTPKSSYLESSEKKQPKRDDEQEEMMRKKNVNDIQKSIANQSHQPKYYHIINPNLNEEDYLTEEETISFFRQLTLKNLIIFLMLLSLLMVGLYKFIEGIYQIQHPEEVMSRKIKDKRLSMTKQSSSVGKQQREAQTQKHSVNIQGPKSVSSPLQITQKRFSSKFYSSNQETNPGSIQKAIQSQSLENKKDDNQEIAATQRPSESAQQKTEQNDSVLRQKEQDIIQSISNNPQENTIHTQSYQSSQLQANKQNPQAMKTNQNQHGATLSEVKANPTIQNSAQYLWNTYDTAPVPKASITKSQAIKWKSFIKMIELPLATPCEDNQMLWDEYEYFENKYQISQYAQLPICVVVPSFNNAQNNRYRMNIQSILQQNYTNYHVVFIDDKSDDNTGQLLKDYLSSFEPKYQQKVKIIINQQRKMAMPNLRYAAMNQCQQNELFIIIDGDDSLVGRQVFKLFSAVMQEKNLWVMWTNFINPKGTIGYSRQYPQIHRSSNNYRKAGFVMSHLRAYYTKLFRLIKEEDLKDQNGQYFHAANDVAIGIPILEMAHLHSAYVPEISYFYNMNTGLNNHRVRLKQQKTNDKKIRKKPRYDPLESLDFVAETKAPQQPISLQTTDQSSIINQQAKQANQIQENSKPLDINEMEYQLHEKANKAYLKEHGAIDS